MSKIYYLHKELRSNYDAHTLVATQIDHKHYAFFDQDAELAAQILHRDLEVYNIAYGKTANSIQIPIDEAKEVFAQIFDEGYSVAIADISEAVTQTPPKELFKKPVETSSNETEPHLQHICSRCGKPLSDPVSMLRGMGKICWEHVNLIGSVESSSPVDTREYRKVLEEVTEDYIPFKVFMEKAKALGIRPSHVMKAVGGDCALLKPVHESFQVFYHGNRRYLHKSALDNIELARKKKMS